MKHTVSTLSLFHSLTQLFASEGVYFDKVLHNSCPSWYTFSSYCLFFIWVILPFDYELNMFPTSHNYSNHTPLFSIFVDLKNANRN